MTSTERLAELFSSCTYDTVPESTKRKSSIGFLDYLECMYAAEEKDSRIQSSLAFALKEPGKQRLLGTKLSSFSSGAAFYNAARGAVSYRNAIVRRGIIHPSEIAFSAALAVADEWTNIRDIFTAFICGVEIMSRLGEGIQKGGKSPSIRMSAVVGSVGAAVASGKVTGLAASQLTSAIALASHYSFGTNQWADEGTGEDVYQAGFSVSIGVMASQLASFGAVGSKSSIEGKNGLFRCFCDSDIASEVYEQNIGKSFAVDELEFKSVEGCLMTQAPFRASMNLVSQEGPQKNFQKVQIHISEQAMAQPGCDSFSVENSVQAKMNIRYVVASVLSGVKPGEIRWNPPYDDALMEKMKRIELVKCENYSKLFPKRLPCLLCLTKEDGTETKAIVEDFGGLSDSEVIERFLDTWKKKKPLQEGQKVVDLILNKTNASLSELTDLLN